RALGFQDSGSFNIPEMMGMQLLAFFHPGEKLYGVIYDHQKIAPTFDICCEFADESGLTGTNTKVGEAMETRPGQETIRIDQGSVKAVFDAVCQKAAGKERRPGAVDGFVAQFKRSYVKSMNWRMKKGGVSRDEIRRQAAQKGTELSEEHLEETYKTLRGAY